MPKKDIFGPVDISKLHIRLIDEYGIPIDMMGIDWSFALNSNDKKNNIICQKIMTQII